MIGQFKQCVPKISTPSSDKLGLSFDEIYQLRKRNANGTNVLVNHRDGLLSRIKDGFTSEIAYCVDCQTKYQAFSSISDLLTEFNQYGFHDVCNVLLPRNLETVFDGELEFALPPGFHNQNVTGMFNIIILNIFILNKTLSITYKL